MQQPTSSSTPSAQVLDAHGAFLQRLSHALLRDEHAAEDLAQSVWERYLARRPRTDSPRSWLAAVTRNAAIKRLRSRANRTEREQGASREEALPSVADALAHQSVLKSVADAVLALDEHERVVVLLRYYQDRTVRAIASELDVSESTVKNRLRAAHEALRRRLEEDDASGSFGAHGWAVALAGLTGVRGASSGGLWLLLGTKAKVAALVLAVGVLGAWFVWPDGGAPRPAGSTPPGVAEAANLERDAATVVSERATTPAAGERTAPAQVASTGALAAHVVFASDGAPAAGVRGRLVRESAGDAAPVPFVVEDDGSFLAEALAPGSWACEPFGHARSSFTIEPGVTTELTLSLAAGVHVEGLVLDPLERPLAHAEVFLEAGEQDRWGTQVVALSDAAGRFTLRDLAPYRSGGPWTELAARAHGYETSGAWTVQAAPGERLEPVFRLHARAGTLTGSVEDEDGAPLAGAKIVLANHDRFGGGHTTSKEGFPLDTPAELEVFTDADGRFVCDRVPLTTHRANASCDGRVPAARGFTWNDRRAEVAFVLARGSEVTGVVGVPAGESAGGVVVRATWGLRARERVSTETAADGSYTLRGLPDGPLQLHALRRGLRTRVEELPGTDAGTPRRWDPRLEHLDHLTGTLFDDEGTPLAGWLVALVRPDRPGLWIHETRVAEDGSFEVTTTPGTPFLLEVRLPAPFDAPPFLLVEAPEPGVESELVVPTAALPSAIVRGSVAGAMDLAGVSVTLTRPSADPSVPTPSFFRVLYPDPRTRSFEAGPLPPGTYRLDCEAPGFLGEGATAFELAPDEERVLPPLVLHRAGVLEVTQLAEEGEELHGTVHVVDAEGNAVESKSGERTSFSLMPGAYTVRACGFRVACVEGGATVRAGEVSELTLSVRPGTARGLRLDPAPAADERPLIEVFDADGERWRGDTFAWQEHVTLQGLTLGTWRVEVTVGERHGTLELVVDDLALPTGAALPVLHLR